jgi:hypothetical protein
MTLLPKKNTGIARMLSVLCLVAFFNLTKAQDIKILKNTDGISSFVVTIVQENYYQRLNDSFENNLIKTKGLFLIINGTTLPEIKIRDTVNSVMNSEIPINKKSVHLMVVGDKEYVNRLNRYTEQIFASKWVIQTDTGSFQDSTYRKVSFAEMNLASILAHMNKINLWDIELITLEKVSIRKPKERIPFGIGFGFTQLFLEDHHAFYDIPNTLNCYDILLSKSLDKNFKLSGVISFNLPSKKNAGTMETSFGEGNYSIMGSNLISLRVILSRYMYGYQGLKIYSDVGITKTNLMVMYMKKGGTGFKPEMYSYGSLTVGSRIEIHFSDKLFIDFRPTTNFSLNTGTVINSFNLSFGVNYLIGRRQPDFYEYLKLK